MFLRIGTLKMQLKLQESGADAHALKSEVIFAKLELHLIMYIFYFSEAIQP